MQRSNKAIVEWYYLIPIIIFSAIVPLIVYMKMVPVEGIAFQYWKGSSENADFFAYYKSLWIIIAAALSIISFSICLCLKKIQIKQTRLYIPMGLYAFFVILSTIFAEYKDVALWGFPDRHEGMLVLLSYIIICFVTINLVNEKKHLKIIFGSLFASASIIGIIGIFQYFGHDFFRSSFGKLLILPAAQHFMADTLEFLFGSNTIYSTLYNTNNVGSYMSMLFMLSLVLFILVKNKYQKIALGFFTLLMLANLLGCNSRAGYVGTALALLAAIVFLRKALLDNWKIIIVSLIGIFIVFYSLNYFSQGMIVNRIKYTWQQAVDTYQMDKANNEEAQSQAEDSAAEAETSAAGDWDGKTLSINPENLRLGEEAREIKGGSIAGIPVEIDSDILKIALPPAQLKIIIEGDQLRFKDQDDKGLNLNIIKGGKIITIKDSRYADYSIQINNELMRVQKGEKELYFAMEPGKFKAIDEERQELALNSETIRSGIFAGIYIDINKQQLLLRQDSLQLNIKSEAGELLFSDENATLLAINSSPDSKQFKLQDPRYANFSFNMNENILQVQNGEKTLRFETAEEGFRFVNKDGQDLALLPVEETIKNSIINIKLEQDKMRIVSGTGAEIIILQENGQLILKDANDKPIPLLSLTTANTFSLQDSRFAGYRMVLKDNFLQVQKAGRDYKFAVADGIFKNVNHRGEAVDVESWGFEGKERFISGRGYIWSRTFPMLKDTIILGHGPDTYAIYFPQYDYASKRTALNSINIIVDKPHNMYLQAAANTGLLSLLALLALFLAYLFSSTKQYIHPQNYQQGSNTARRAETKEKKSALTRLIREFRVKKTPSPQGQQPKKKIRENPLNPCKSVSEKNPPSPQAPQTSRREDKNEKDSVLIRLFRELRVKKSPGPQAPKNSATISENHNNQRPSISYAIPGTAIFLAIIAYLGTGVFNDSIVSVAPVFWTLLGLGIACNNLNLSQPSPEKKQNKEGKKRKK